MIKKTVAAMLVILSFGCSKMVKETESETPINTVKHGQFGVVQMDGLAKNSIKMLSVDEDNTIVMELGELTKSKRFFFAITNVGETDITSINITSDKEQFTISPSNIGKLRPQPFAKIWNILEVDIEHGQALDGGEFGELLPIGSNTSTFQFSGISDGVVVTMDLKIIVVSKFGDIQFDVGETTIEGFECPSYTLDLKKDTDDISLDGENSDFSDYSMSRYNRTHAIYQAYPIPTHLNSSFVVTNKGNVNLTLSIIRQSDTNNVISESDVEEINLKSNESKDILKYLNLGDIQFNDLKVTYLEIKTSGTAPFSKVFSDNRENYSKEFSSDRLDTSISDNYIQGIVRVCLYSIDENNVNSSKWLNWYAKK